MIELSLINLKNAITVCSRATGDQEFIVVGSISILGAFPDAHSTLRQSVDIDLFPRYEESGEKNSSIYRLFGPGSEFEADNGFYIEGVGRWTMMTALDGWEERMIPIETEEGALGWCIAPIDLAFVKIEAGREKDIKYVGELFRSGIIQIDEMRESIRSLSSSMERIDELEKNLNLAIAAYHSRSRSL